MADATAELALLISARNEASKVFKTVETDSKSLGSTLGDVAKIATGFLAASVIGQGFGALKSGIIDSIALASDFNESLSKTRVVFGDSSKAVEDFASTAAKSLGMSKGAALEATSTFGNFLQALGTARGPATDMSMAMVQLASDLASFNNVNPEEVLLALRSGLSGEAEPMRRFGVALSETAVKAKAAQMGLNTVNGELTEAQKIQARYAIIMEQTATAQGDFARTSDGLANKQRIVAASMEDLKTKIGQVLLPVQLALTTFIVDKMIPAIEKLADKIGPFLVEQFEKARPTIEKMMQAFSAGADVLKDVFLPILESLVEFITSHKAIMIAAFVAIGVAIALALGPVSLAAIAIISMITLVGYVKQHWDELKAKAEEIFGSLPGPIKAAMKFIYDEVVTRVEGVKEVFNGIVRIIGDVIALVSDLFHGRWREAWEDLKRIASGILDTLLGYIKSQVGNIPSIIAGFAGEAATAAGNLAKGMYRAVVEGLQDLVIWVEEHVLNPLVRAWNSTLGTLMGKMDELDTRAQKAILAAQRAGEGTPAQAAHETDLVQDDVPPYPWISRREFAMRQALRRDPGGPFYRPGYALGTPFVPQTGLAMLHRGEAVIPASMNTRTGAVIINVNVHGSILSEREIERIIQDSLRRGGLSLLGQT